MKICIILCGKYQHHNKKVVGRGWEVDRQKSALSKCATPYCLININDRKMERGRWKCPI
jgi:hypothetical protein